MRQTLRFEELNTADLLAAGFDKVILPIGSCESHGDHLPFGIDAFIAYDLAHAVAGRVGGTMVLPPIWYGTFGRGALICSFGRGWRRDVGAGPEVRSGSGQAWLTV